MKLKIVFRLLKNNKFFKKICKLCGVICDIFLIKDYLVKILLFIKRFDFVFGV